MSEPLVRGAIVNELGTAFRYAQEIANAELRAVGVDPTEYHPLSFIGVMQPVTRTQLTAATGYPRTTVRDILRAVIERGHARELPNPRDGRSTLLELTPAGQAIFDMKTYGGWFVDSRLKGILVAHGLPKTLPEAKSNGASSAGFFSTGKLGALVLVLLVLGGAFVLMRRRAQGDTA